MTTPSGQTSAIRLTQVLGIPIQDPLGRKIGVVEDIVLHKLSNSIMFAVLSFGGFFGMGEKYHPVPWSRLTYNPDDHSYLVTLSKEQLQAAPTYSVEELTEDDGHKHLKTLFEFYDVPYNW